ncbi:universal stress protein [Enterovirga sp.]|uniref:universal stress protein n=1 Tax=Enterovirga sp. TaxID=2026350 RepID=UPI002C627C25|nr:universal stress protein [Enterovirga sp.]HMO28299.1 universal stress protein [Enterovirga sp.]
MLERVKDIHVVLCPDEGRTGAAAAFGLSLAQAAQAHVTVQAASVRITIPHSIISNVGSALVREENKRRLEAAENTADACRKNAAAQGSACTALAFQIPFPEAVAACGRRSRLHDLTILDARADALRLERAVVEEILFKCGRPVLVVPEGHDAFRPGHAMVAWDGSAQAARALNDALPLLAAARTVSLVSVAEPGKEDALPGADIARHLSRHGIQVTLVDLKASQKNVESILRDQSHAHRTDLIVMGAYAHSWWREIALGGVTQSFIGDPPAPLFLSH